MLRHRLVTGGSGGGPGGGGPRALRGRVRPDGQRMRDDVGRALLLFTSGFTLPTLAVRDTAAADRFCAWAKRTRGFNGVRMMAGALPWASQTPQQALDGLPVALGMARDYGLHVKVTALTETGTGYDYERHLAAVATVCAQFDITVGEVANEPYHATQAGPVHDFENLLHLGRQTWEAVGVSWACGAPETDEPGPTFPDMRGSSFGNVHLGRGRDLWNMVRHQREMQLLAAQYKMPFWNGEPIGWDEREEPGRRCSRPEIAFAMGALSRGFGLSLTSHAQHGLRAELPGPVQDECHAQVVRGFTAYGHEADLAFVNAGWSGSPVAGANFSRDADDPAGPNEGTLTRAYTFMDAPDHGWTNLVGVTGDTQVRWANGFAPVGVTAEAGALPSEGGIGKHVIVEVRR